MTSLHLAAINQDSAAEYGVPNEEFNTSYDSYFTMQYLLKAKGSQ